MTLRRRVLNTLDGRVDPRIVAGLGSVYLSARGRSYCHVRYDDGDWVHRDRQGVIVDTSLDGRSPALQDKAARDVFLFDYQPRPGDTVVDLGAGVGGEVRLFSRLVGSSGRVVSIEAHPRTFRCLRRTIELNRLTNVIPVECAVVGAPGTVLLEDDPVAHIGNALTTDTTGSVQVVGRTLTEILDSLEVAHVDLLKMNIEGGELAVLEQFRDSLTMVDNLTVSCHDFKADRGGGDWQRTFASVTALLGEAGYAIRTRPGDPRPWVRYYAYASRR